jgi:putative endonuclease
MAPRRGKRDIENRDRRRAERRGYVSEYLAAIYLMLKGYRILALRYRTKQGEIDIVARKKDVVIFVEVKARRDEGEALDAVGWTTQERIRAASEIWMSRRHDAAMISYRYDIIAMIPGQWPRHFFDAF